MRISHFAFDLCLERVYEDHELLLENLMLWPRDSNNRLLFVMRPEKVLLFESPSLFFSGDRSYTCDSDFAKVSINILRAFKLDFRNFRYSVSARRCCEYNVLRIRLKIFCCV